MAIITPAQQRQGSKMPPPKVKPSPAPPPEGESRFEFLKSKFESFRSQFYSVGFVKKAAWCAFLAFIYVVVQNAHDKLTYDIYRTKDEMNETKALYVSRNAEYMYSSKRSEITKRLDSLDLDKSIVPPIKIVAQDEEDK